MLGEVVPEPALHAGRPLVRAVRLDPGRRDPQDPVTLRLDVDLAPHTAIGAHRPGHPVRVRERPLGRNGCLGMNSKIAPVGQTRTHSPHQVQPALSGLPSPPTMISVCAPRSPRPARPTSWMSSQARTQRVQRMQSYMSCWIISSPGRVSPSRSAERRVSRVVRPRTARRTLEFVPGISRPPLLEMLARDTARGGTRHALPAAFRPPAGDSVCTTIPSAAGVPQAGTSLRGRPRRPGRSGSWRPW